MGSCEGLGHGVHAKPWEVGLNQQIKTPLEELAQLRQLLVDHFNEGELRTLCFDLGVDYENLPPGGKADKARELVAHLERRNQIPELLEMGRRLRPDVDWSQTYLDDRMADYRARRDQADQLRRERRGRQRVVNLRPLDVTHTFKDRVREMQELSTHLAQGNVRLVCIVGRGGMGKTALASRVLADLEDTWLLEKSQVSGILYLSARSTGLSLERIYTDVGRMLGEPAASRLAARWASGEIPLVAKVEYLLETMQDGLYLILLDNLEDHLSPDGTIADEGLRLFVEHCLTQPGGARLIATSREQVQVASAALRNARHIPLRDGLPEDEAMALLRALDPSGELGLRDAPESDLRRAVQLTGGIPRALEIIAGILQADPTTSLPRLLAGKSLFGEQVVESLVAASYHRLGENERHVMESLAVFGCPIEETAIAYLLYPWCPDLDVRSCLRRLVNSYFVSVNRSTGAYSLHLLDREYAYLHLPEEIETEIAVEKERCYTRRNLELRAADFYASIYKPESEWKTGEDLSPQLAEFEHRVRAGDYDGACRVLDLVDLDYFYKWSEYHRVWRMREKLSGHLVEPRLHLSNLGSLGRICRGLGRFEQAIQFHKDALAIARQLRDRFQESVQLGDLGLACANIGHTLQAIELYEEALDSARQVDNRRLEGVWISSLGTAYKAIGRIEDAFSCFEQALDISYRIGHRRETGINLGHLGSLYLVEEECEKAIDYYQQSLSIARDIGDRRGESARLGSLGNAYYLLGQIQRSEELYNQSLSISGEIGDQSTQSRHLIGLGKSLLLCGRLLEAKQYFATSYEMNIPRSHTKAAIMLGISLLHQRQPAARNYFVEAIAGCRALLDRTENLYELQYILSAAMVGQAVCDSRWADASQRAELLAPALAEYRRALEITSAAGVVGDAIRDLELIRAAGIEGLKPAFELLESARGQNA